MAITYTAIATTTVGSGGAANITFSSIPGTYTDLAVKMSSRLTTSGYDGTPWVSGLISFNNTDITSGRILFGTGSTTGTDTNASEAFITDTDATASTFASMDMYLTNYLSSNNKSISVDVVTENNGTSSVCILGAALSTVTSAITSIKFTPTSGNYAQYTTATLYGIKNTV